MGDKNRGTNVRNTYLISARLLGCLCMSALHDVAQKMSYACAESDSYTIKSHFLRSQTTANDTKYL